MLDLPSRRQGRETGSPQSQEQSSWPSPAKPHAGQIGLSEEDA
jgi:hypothetical protein